MSILLRTARSLFGRPAKPVVAAVAPASVTAAQWQSRGNAALAAERLDEAVECYAQAASADPSDAVARLSLGFALLEKSDATGALQNLARALVLKQPHQAILHDIHYLTGRAHQQLGDSLRAAASYEAAISALPGFAEPIEGLVQLHGDAGRHEDALRWWRRLNEVRPWSGAQIAIARQLDKLLPEALSALDDLLRREPNNPDAWTGRGNVMFEIRQYQAALQAFERAVEISGPTAASLTNLGMGLSKCGRGEEALERVDAALQLAPDNGTMQARRAAMLLALLRVDEAIDTCRKGLAMHPENADLHWTLAIAYLLAGRLKQGWQEHEWRWAATAAEMRPLPRHCIQWTGDQDLHGKTILLSAEQGLGDTIQMLRYVPLVTGRGARVLLQLQKPFHGLHLTSGMEGSVTLLSSDAALPRADYQCPLLSLPLAFASEEASLPRVVPYLCVSPEKAERWRTRLAKTGPGLKVGVVWSGNESHRNDHNRSIALEKLRSIQSEDCVFVSLQTQVRDRDRAALENWPQLLRWGEELSDFDETAALLDALDVVVSVDTSVAHLAGALARPVFILLPYSPDWRWMLNREDTPWYPTARLFRQEKARDWDSVLHRVRKELQQRASS